MCPTLLLALLGILPAVLAQTGGTADTPRSKKLAIGIVIPIGILLLSLGICVVFYNLSRRKSVKPSGPKGAQTSSRATEVSFLLSPLDLSIFVRRRVRPGL